jgi:hypothetical protein
MITFGSNKAPDIELTIQKGSSSDRSELLALKRHTLLGDGVDVIYIYSLAEEVVTYPNGDGNVIYIGEAGREQKTGTRFSQHISTEETTGGDTGTNYTLSCYYWTGRKINLKIYCVGIENDKTMRCAIEEKLLRQHLKTFGALPIAQGASGERCTVSVINSVDLGDVLASLPDPQ